MPALQPRQRSIASIPTSLEFFSTLRWLDGRPLLSTIEPYRKRIFRSVLDSSNPKTGQPRYSLALCGRAKKNWKTADLILAALYRLLVWQSPQGNDCFILANDEEQAGDDLSLAKKLIQANPILDREVNVAAKSISRRDGKGTLMILPAGDVVGAHGKTFLFVGYDEIHGYKSHDLFEALAPDPTRPDVLVWITSYAGIRHAAGVPLYDYLLRAKRGDDPKMYFSWYGGDYGTDAAFTKPSLTPEQRANPSMRSWVDAGYLDQQRLRLPSHKYRRLHLNLPGAPDGAAFSGDSVMAAIVPGRKRLPYEPHRRYRAFVDMSGGSNDEAVLAIAHLDEQTGRGVLDLVESQAGKPPFNPRTFVRKAAGLLHDYKLHRCSGDAFGGLTFKVDFSELGISYTTVDTPKSDLYEELEPRLNAGVVELLDVTELQEQALTLVWRGGKIDHAAGDHDDFINSAAGALSLVMTQRNGWAVWADKQTAAIAAGDLRPLLEPGSRAWKDAQAKALEGERMSSSTWAQNRLAEVEPPASVPTVKLKVQPHANFFCSGPQSGPGRAQRYAADERGIIEVDQVHVEVLKGQGAEPCSD